MPLNDIECNKCGTKKEYITLSINEKINKNCECGGKFKKIFPTKSPNFKLIYNNATDMVDWDGNTSRYWEDYKKMKAEGKNPRIPKLDGDGK